MKQYTFRLDISYNSYQQYYSGYASSVMVVTDNGLSLKLPAAKFRPFLTQIGIKGYFRLTTDDNSKFIKLEQLSG